MSSKRPIRAASGFSLIELLVALCIGVLVMGLLLPAVSKARQAAGQAACASNLRQWGQAVQLYAGENHNYLPRRGQGVESTAQIDRDADWFNALPPVMGMPAYQTLIATGRTPGIAERDVWLCPQRPDRLSGYLFTYGMNMWLSTWSAPQPDRIDRLSDVSTLVFMADAPSGHCSVVPANADYSPAARHAGRVNIVFLDGHVEAPSSSYVGCGVGDPQRPDVRWIVPGSSWKGPH
jgi:prepilin-type processing-associated H-X9-DG protein